MLMSIRNSCIALMIVGLAGCDRPVQSQQSFGSMSDDGGLSIQDSISVGRLNAITRAVETATPAVVSVNVTQVQRVRSSPLYNDPFYEFFFGRQRSRVLERQVKNMGSGFVVSPDGYIVTNDHVAGEAVSITVAFPDGRTYEAELIGSDTATDLALLKVEPEEDLPWLQFETSSDPIVGEWAIALGNPFGLFEAAEPTVTVGVVSATGRDLQPQQNRFYMDMIQTDAAINRGNSGGPLLNALGRVIGVNAAIYTESGGSIGIGFAVPADRAVRVLDEIREKGYVDRSYYTGLRGRAVTARIAQALGLPETRGVFVEEIDPGSPADEGGFMPYDVIMTVGGETVSDRESFVAALLEYRPGDRLEFEVYRDGQMIRRELVLASQGSR
ncbi:MAG: PDZ domain-containing protein [Rhodothermales bacterium]|nr:PDZ domain-containing protein [Rhodothermales bacterium]